MRERYLNHRFGLVAHFVIFFVTVSFVLRTVLLIKTADSASTRFLDIVNVYATGLFFDLAFCSYAIIPFVIYLVAAPDRFFRHPVHKYAALFIYFALFYLLSFGVLAEWFFWDEFGVRFNFIAVDYLVYTTEVVGNIRESYPVEKLLLLLLFVVSLVFYLFGIRGGRLNAPFTVQTNFQKRAKTGTLLLLPALFWAFCGRLYRLVYLKKSV